MNPQAPKLPRVGTIRRAVVECITQTTQNHQFTWSELKRVYDTNADGHPSYTGMELSRLLKKWTVRTARGIYAPKWLKCACNTHLLAHSVTAGTDGWIEDGVLHTWGSCEPTVPMVDDEPQGRNKGIPDEILQGMAANGSADGNPWLEPRDADFEIVEDKQGYLNQLYGMRDDAYVLLEDGYTQIRNVKALIDEIDKEVDLATNL